jgi:hypothetical protein
VAPVVCDPLADREHAKQEYELDLSGLEGQPPFDAVIYAVPHSVFQTLSPKDFARLCQGPQGLSEEAGNRVAESQSYGIIIDVKSQLDRRLIEEQGLIYWAL